MLDQRSPRQDTPICLGVTDAVKPNCPHGDPKDRSHSRLRGRIRQSPQGKIRHRNVPELLAVRGPYAL